MAFAREFLSFWLIQLVALALILLDTSCLIYAGVRLVPSGSLFGKTLTAEDQEDMVFSMWVCGALVMASFVVWVVGRLSRKWAMVVLSVWYVYIITYGDNVGARAISVLYYMELEWPLQRIRAMLPSDFVLSDDILTDRQYWWWFAHVTVWAFACWWGSEVRQASQVDGGHGPSGHTAGQDDGGHGHSGHTVGQVVLDVECEVEEVGNECRVVVEEEERR